MAAALEAHLSERARGNDQIHACTEAIRAVCRDARLSPDGAETLIPRLTKPLETIAELTGDETARALATLSRRYAAQDDASTPEKFEKLAHNLFAMHRFLDGIAGADQFGNISLHNDENIQYGLGLSLHDGSLLQFFTDLIRKNPDAPYDMLFRSFSDDAEPLIRAIQEGQASLESFLHSQLVLRYDPILSRKTFTFPQQFLAHFQNLAAEPAARDTQVSLLAGKRFTNARKHAISSGIRSLRGFAMLFDLHALASDSILSNINPDAPETNKCLTLADSVISRMHGHVAEHWQNRLESVFQGAGTVDGRIYDETRYLGLHAEDQSWETPLLQFKDDNITQEPSPGHAYIVCPGDRLTTLTDNAYKGLADYRFVLRQNPHIRHPEALRPGTRLFFPKLTSDTRTDERDENRQKDTATFYSEASNSIFFASREISDLRILTRPQIDALCAALDRIVPARIAQTQCVRFRQHAAVICGQIPLVILTQENLERIGGSDPAASLYAWACALAAQIRGDVMLSEGRFLPLASMPAQPHRNAWCASSLHRLLADHDARPPKLILHPSVRAVDILDAYNAFIMRLEHDDFSAIRQQPGRRLTDYIAPPIIQMETLSQIWISELLSQDTEIVVPPVSHANLYASAPHKAETHFRIPAGTPVYPILPGIVQRIQPLTPDCFQIFIRHPHGLTARYAGLMPPFLSAGQTVTQQTVLSCAASPGAESVSTMKLELRQNASSDCDIFDGEQVAYLNIVNQLWPLHAGCDSIMGE